MRTAKGKHLVSHTQCGQQGSSWHLGLSSHCSEDLTLNLVADNHLCCCLVSKLPGQSLPIEWIPFQPKSTSRLLRLATENPVDAMEDFFHLRILQSTTFLKIACSNLSNPDYRCGVVLLSQTWSTCPHTVKASPWHQGLVKEITAFIAGAKEEWGELMFKKPKLPQGF